MSVAVRRRAEASQVDTAKSARAPATPQIEPDAASVAALPPAEQSRTDRRGPMRPVVLTPTRSRLTGWMLGVIFRVFDAVALTMIGFVAAAIATGGVTLAGVTPFMLGAVVLVWSLSTLKAYGFAQREDFGRHLVRVAAGFGLAALLLELVLVGFKPAVIAPRPFGLWFASSFAVFYALHAIWWMMVRSWRAKGRLTPNIVVVGATANAQRLIEAALKSRDAAVLGVFDDRADRIPQSLAGVPVLGDTAALLDHRIMPFVDRIVITVPQNAQARVRQLIERLEVLPNEVMLFIDQGAASREAALSRITEAPLAPVSGEPSDERRALVKRAQDLVVGGLAMLVAAPLMLLIAIAIKLDSPGPVFFRQRRHGFNSEVILVWKFRSMRHGADKSGGTRQIRYDDDRVTRVGHLIRRTSLDELPQLFNVLKGEMSLVGPRPHAVGMKTGDTESAKLVAEYAHRNRMKPGMTGWAAIKGSRGPVDTPELVRQRVALDIEYIERQSLMLDLMVMALTLPCLIGDKKTVR
jgi:Undecaprenyl-phosphate glucose phosphotransferase